MKEESLLLLSDLQKLINQVVLIDYTIIILGCDNMYYLAACDNDGRCFGYLRTDNTVSKDPDNEIDKLICFKKKSEASEKVMQINLGHLLLPNGSPFRVTVVKG